MIIQNIEKKIRIGTYIGVFGILMGCFTAIISLYFAYQKIDSERQKIYVLDNGIPVLVNRTDQIVNRIIEYKSHIEMFHLLFFTLPPDDKFIEKNMQKAIYLIDESGLAQYNNLKERGYFNAIISSSSVLSIQTDSIKINKEKKSFVYYGTQRIERKTTILKRSLQTKGYIEEVPRTENNPHGLLIKNWKTILNKDISTHYKKQF
ncbi:MAG: conjugative transposon protein TraK [Flavobacteriaceae bacterium]|nr:conjugative transposon protein TraK [Flavobacteriaceae bacterium]